MPRLQFLQGLGAEAAGIEGLQGLAHCRLASRHGSGIFVVGELASHLLGDGTAQVEVAQHGRKRQALAAADGKNDSAPDGRAGWSDR